MCTSHELPRCRLLLVMALCLFLPALRASASQAQQPVRCDALITVAPEDTAAAARLAVCNLVNTGSMADLRWPNFAAFREAAIKFYAPEYALVWAENNRPTPQALAMVELLQQAAKKGLRPDDYDGPRWQDRLQRFAAPPWPSPAELAAFDAALTISAMRYVSDLCRGRVNPRHLRYGLPAKSCDPAAILRNQIIHAADVKSAVEQLEPAFPRYQLALKALEKYSELARQGEDEPLAPTAKPLLPGQTYAALPRLATKLRRVGDLPADAQLPEKPDLYSGALVEAVQRFQSRHGLTPDGQIGQVTLQELNTPYSQRVIQLQLTLERWRWLPASVKPPLVVVNIPEFQLRAYDNQHLALTMRVVVGKAFDHQTPVFIDQMEYVIFRPYWNVPVSIVKKEIVPILRNRPNYLVRERMELLDHQGNVIPSETVDRNLLRQLNAGKLEIRQTPGAWNALGLVKFVFPNQYDVYMHGTPQRQLFARSRRDFSHGCIRVEDPESLAEWALKNHVPWTREKIVAAMKGEDTIQVTLPRPINVLIVYGTAMADENGEARFFRDIYGLDAALERALAAPHP